MRTLSSSSSSGDQTQPSRSQSEPAVPAPNSPAKPVWRGGFIRGFGYAFEGIFYTLRTQRNMLVHLAIGLVAVGLGLWLGLTTPEWAALLATMALVYCLEMVNTVVEALVDLVTDRQYHPLAKVAKDVGAGAVLVAAIFALAVGLVLFLPRLWPLVWHLFIRG